MQLMSVHLSICNIWIVWDSFSHIFDESFDYLADIATDSSQGRLKLWTSDLRAFFLNLNPAGIWKSGSNMIWTPLRNIHFSKVSRLSLKNCACHALLNSEIQRGMAGSILVPQPCIFEKLCIFYRSSNDISTNFLCLKP